MDDLSGKISQVLSDPQAMEQIKELAAMFGADTNAKSEPERPLPVPKQKQNVPDMSALSGDTVQTIMRIMPLLSEFKKEDKNTRLLNALRPFLGEDKQHKLDEAERMLSMMKLLPMLRSLNI